MSQIELLRAVKISRMFIIILLGACQSSMDRSAWLKEQLYSDNRIWLQRQPELLADKFSKIERMLTIL